MRLVRLRKGIASTLRKGHPWVYRDAIEEPQLEAGEWVRLVDGAGKSVGIGFADEGPIALRLLAPSTSSLEPDWLRCRVASALKIRKALIEPKTNAYRWIHGEADRLPGLVVDRYDSYLVIRFDSEGAALFYGGKSAHFEELVDALRAAEPTIKGILLRKGRGISKKTELLWGQAPPLVTVLECGMKLLVDLQHGQKTGLFLDHRHSRQRIRHLAHGRRVLDLYGYTGAFSVAAGLGKAREVHTVDTAEAALKIAHENWLNNGLPPSSHITICADVPSHLKELRKKQERFDLIIADPPSFAPHADAVPQAMRSYITLHRACLDLLTPGGIYFAASCSSHISITHFDESIREAASSFPRHLRILERWGGGPDHPRTPSFPEGDYLKCLLMMVEPG
ncbi:MAG: class I SAM-dependent rRNA methyltransferase [Sandaracinaceae bacterium]|nr:class I SAM-dependent rRNA methyltransferase [Sandaracinaceae bacterium]